MCLTKNSDLNYLITDLKIYEVSEDFFIKEEKESKTTIELYNPYIQYQKGSDSEAVT